MAEKASIVDEGMLTVDEAIEHSRMSRSELYLAMTRGELGYAKWGKRRLIPRKALNDLLKAKMVGGAT